MSISEALIQSLSQRQQQAARNPFLDMAQAIAMEGMQAHPNRYAGLSNSGALIAALGPALVGLGAAYLGNQERNAAQSQLAQQLQGLDPNDPEQLARIDPTLAIAKQLENAELAAKQKAEIEKFEREKEFMHRLDLEKLGIQESGKDARARMKASAEIEAASRTAQGMISAAKAPEKAFELIKDQWNQINSDKQMVGYRSSSSYLKRIENMTGADIASVPSNAAGANQLAKHIESEIAAGNINANELSNQLFTASGKVGSNGEALNEGDINRKMSDLGIPPVIGSVRAMLGEGKLSPQQMAGVMLSMKDSVAANKEVAASIAKDTLQAVNYMSTKLGLPKGAAAALMPESLKNDLSDLSGAKQKKKLSPLVETLSKPKTATYIKTPEGYQLVK